MKEVASLGVLVITLPASGFPGDPKHALFFIHLGYNLCGAILRSDLELVQNVESRLLMEQAYKYQVMSTVF